MTIETYGDITTTNEYWDCSCDENYIHPYSNIFCPVCHDTRDESPDSRLNDVQAAGLPVSLEVRKYEQLTS